MNVLVIAPHSDDEILGVGGTIAKHIALGDDVYVCIVANHDVPLYTSEQKRIIHAETNDAHNYLGIKETYFLDFVAVVLREEASYKLNSAIRKVVYDVKPETVYIPHFGDIHKDHQIVAMASQVAIRPVGQAFINTVYAYETLSETEWNTPHSANVFIPNHFVDISDYLEKKLEAMKRFKSQLYSDPHPRSLNAITALSRYRGSTISVKAAEAFSVIKQIR